MQGYCGACGQGCNVKLIDEGIGSYEFWGFVGTHEQWVAVSDCCEDDVYANEAHTVTITPSDVSDDCADDYI